MSLYFMKIKENKYHYLLFHYRGLNRLVAIDLKIKVLAVL